MGATKEAAASVRDVHGLDLADRRRGSERGRLLHYFPRVPAPVFHWPVGGRSWSLPNLPSAGSGGGIGWWSLSSPHFE